MNARTILANLDWPGLSLKIAALLVTAAFAWQALKSDVEANTKDISRLERLQGEQQKTNEKVLGGLAWLKGR